MKRAFLLLVLAVFLIGTPMVTWRVFRTVHADTLLLKELEDKRSLSKDDESLVLDLYYRTAQEGSTDGERLSILGDILSRMNMPLEASDMFSQLVELYPENLGIRNEYVVELAKAGKFEQADKQLNQLLAAAKEDDIREYFVSEKDLLLRSARNAYEAGKLDMAIKRFARLLKKFPKHTEARAEYAGILATNKRFGDSEQQYKILIAAEPQKLEYIHSLVNVYETQEDYAKATGLLREFLKDRSDNRDLRLRLAEIESSAKNYDAATKVYQAILDDFPSDEKIMRQFLEVLLWAKKTDMFDKHAQEYLRAHPADTELRIEAIGAYEGERDYSGAERIARDILQRDPENFFVHHKLAQLLTWQKRYPEAIEQYKQLFDLQPESVDLLKEFAEVLLWDRKYDEVIPLTRRMLRQGEKDRRVWATYLDAIRFAEREPNEEDAKNALALYQEAITEPGLDRGLATKLGSALRKTRQLDESITLLKMLLEVDPSDRYARLQLADSLAAAKRYQEADEHYQILVESLRHENKQE